MATFNTDVNITSSAFTDNDGALYFETSDPERDYYLQVGLLQPRCRNARVLLCLLEKKADNARVPRFYRDFEKERFSLAARRDMYILRMFLEHPSPCYCRGAS